MLLLSLECTLFSLLSRLYRSLEDYDVVRGIFGGKVGTKSITCAALQAEANTDYDEAAKLYNEVSFPQCDKPNILLSMVIMMSIDGNVLQDYLVCA